MKKLSAFESIHQKSFLCMIGAFRDLLEYNGHKYSYPFCFGLSSEMGFCYGHDDSKNGQFTYMAAPSYSIEHSLYNMCRVTNVWSETGRTSDKEKLKNIIKKYVDEERPVLLEVEATSFFEALRVPTFTVNKNTDANRFKIGGHNVLVVGYDDKEENFTIIEALLQHSIKINMEILLDSCVVNDCLMAPEGKWAVFYVPPVLPEEDYMVYQSLVHHYKQMKSNYHEKKEFYYGLEGMTKFFEELISWPELMTSDELVRNLTVLYDFERMGQGGGFFRSVYAQFLKEESESLNFEELKSISDEYFELGRMWTEFTEKIRYLINNPTLEAFKKTLSDQDLQMQIVDKEAKTLDEIETILRM